MANIGKLLLEAVNFLYLFNRKELKRMQVMLSFIFLINLITKIFVKLLEMNEMVTSICGGQLYIAKSTTIDRGTKGA